ncbi:protein of unknown function [Trichlorobacter ammonificans]|uniref:Uncharacterized protein n=1 Tax=Trichlorobacter ammonificans TaxID=2916410 RepID=A0ABM9D8P7_9BACT|nr:protein of unknown function [Trichlorobacter ammonificans]
MGRALQVADVATRANQMFQSTPALWDGRFLPQAGIHQLR